MGVVTGVISKYLDPYSFTLTIITFVSYQVIKSGFSQGDSVLNQLSHLCAFIIIDIISCCRWKKLKQRRRKRLKSRMYFN